MSFSKYAGGRGRRRRVGSRMHLEPSLQNYYWGGGRGRGGGGGLAFGEGGGGGGGGGGGRRVGSILKR